VGAGARSGACSSARHVPRTKPVWAARASLEARVKMPEHGAPNYASRYIGGAHRYQQ